MVVVPWSQDLSLSYDVCRASLGEEYSAVDRTDIWCGMVGCGLGTTTTRFGSPRGFWGKTWTQRALARWDRDPDQLQLIEFASGAVTYDRSDKAAASDGDDSAGLYIALNGRIRLLQSDHAAELGPGHMGVVRYCQGARVSYDDGFHGYLLSIPSYALPPARDPHGRLGLRPQNAVLRTVRLLADNLAAERLELEGAEFIAISRALVDLVAGALDERRAPQLDVYARIAADACRRIDLYSDDPRLSVQTLADSLGCSRRQLEIAMKTVSGTTPGEQLRETRLRRAYERLADPDNTQAIVDVATSSGYNSLSGFRASFAARFGIQPGELKLQARSTDQAQPRPKPHRRSPGSH
ncbi:AraC family transcriptional regulator [Nocardia sp. CDC159]|uniref:AraC family transcriptional regulator n=1 Tax=Nocardia pulmonis TaxID=2951408 RepID=A0A9X2EDS2_9NOCA|nr:MULTISPECIES: AraC family transcriptional regulator [Nocardia]MCM6777600.1 AraC family transcriptional regulator [Nocardia pulmonis]MCM6790596.1 AraC family transcriptional regulator [Nocardia sp. CDC159]